MGRLPGGQARAWEPARPGSGGLGGLPGSRPGGLPMPSILDLGSGTGHTDRQTDRQRLSLHNAPTIWKRGHNYVQRN